MRFEIPCKTFVRISSASLQMGETLRTKENREYLRSVKLEHRGGHTFAVASNSIILAVELVGETDEPNGSVNVTIADDLLDHCRAEESLESTLTITYSDGWAVAQTTYGYIYPANASVDGEWPVDWKALLAQTSPNKGAIGFDPEYISRLGMSSPSQRLIFPRLETMQRPVIVNDMYDPDWIGAFYSILNDDTDPPTPFKFATLKDWAK